MTVSFTHLRVSSVPDSTDATLIQPSDWNAGHVLSCASGVLLGRTSAGDGAVEEVSLGGLPITGGSINGTPIGGTTPAAGVFTTLTGNSTCAFGAGSANYLQAVGAASGSVPTISAIGSDTNVSINIKGQGASFIRLQNGTTGTNQFVTAGSTASVNYLQAAGGTTGNPPTLSAQGSNADIDLSLTPKGTGLVRFGTYTAGAPTATGYISIKDSTGTIYKVLVST